MAITDRALRNWFVGNQFEQYMDILVRDLGVESLNDFKLLRDENDVNELISDMEHLKPMNIDFKQKFKKSIMKMLNPIQTERNYKPKPIQTDIKPQNNQRSQTPSSLVSPSSIITATSPASSISSSTSSSTLKSTSSAPASRKDKKHHKKQTRSFISSANAKNSRSATPTTVPSKRKSVDTKNSRSATPTTVPLKRKSADIRHHKHKKTSSLKLKKDKDVLTDLKPSSSSSLSKHNKLFKKSHSTKDFLHKNKHKNKNKNKNTSLSLLDAKKRKEMKEKRNKGRGGITLHTNRRVRLDDGRIGIIKYKGRTAFGKSSEDWIGLVIEYGKGQHNGSVNGRSYFRCRDGKGLMVRPDRVIEDLGNPMTKPLDDLMKQGSDEIQALLKKIKKDKKLQKIREKKKAEKLAAMNNANMNYGGDVGWKPAKFDDFKEDQSIGLYKQKLIHSKTLLDKHKNDKIDKKKRHDAI